MLLALQLEAHSGRQVRASCCVHPCIAVPKHTHAALQPWLSRRCGCCMPVWCMRHGPDVVRRMAFGWRLLGVSAGSRPRPMRATRELTVRMRTMRVMGMHMQRLPLQLLAVHAARMLILVLL